MSLAIEKLEQILDELKENESESATSFMYKMPDDIAVKIAKFISKNIDIDDLYNDDGFGIESSSHVSILLFVTSGKEDVADVLNEIGKIECTFAEIKAFKNTEADVLYISFDDKTVSKLREVYKRLRDINVEYANDYIPYDVYVPHCTLVYLKSGEASKYISEFKNFFSGVKFTIKELSIDSRVTLK